MLRQKANAFIRWLKANGVKVEKRKRKFWGKKAWRKPKGY